GGPSRLPVSVASRDDRRAARARPQARHSLCVPSPRLERRARGYAHRRIAQGVALRYAEGGPAGTTRSRPSPLCGAKHGTKRNRSKRRHEAHWTQDRERLSPLRHRQRCRFAMRNVSSKRVDGGEWQTLEAHSALEAKSWSVRL